MPALGSVAGGGSWLLCGEMEKGALWMGSCLQSLEEPSEHSAWEPGGKSQGTTQLPMVLLRPTDNPTPHTRPPLTAQTSTEDADTPPSDSHRSTLAQSRAPQGSCFPTASSSSGVTVSGPQVTTCPPTCSCPEGEPPLKSHFPAHGDVGTWRCPERAPVAARPGVASSSLTGITLGALLVKDQRHPG